MKVSVEIPDELAGKLAAAGKNAERTALESLLVEAYRRRMIFEGEIKRILGYGTRMRVHELLKEYDVPLDYTVEDLEQDRETFRWLDQMRAAKVS